MISTFITNMDSPIKLIYGAALIILIVYSSMIPIEYRTFADSLLGRVFGIATVYGVIETLGWVYGLLTALAFLLILNGAPRYGNPMMEGFLSTDKKKETFMPPYQPSEEGFTAGGAVTAKNAITHNRRWFVEEVLGECPIAIESDRVTTQAVQD